MMTSLALGRVTEPSPSRAQVRRFALATIALLALMSLSPALAGDGGVLSTEASGPARAGPELGLGEALALARGDQPVVAAFEQEAAAFEEAAQAARSLPDPQVSAGIQNLPVTGDMAFNPTADFMTMYTIGVMREQVRRSRREAESAQLRAEAVVARMEGSARQREIQRQVMISWIEAVESSAKQKLLAQIVKDLETGRKVMEAAIPTGGSNAALVLQAQAEIALAETQLAAARGAEARARGELARWIGEAAWRPIPDKVPNLAVSMDPKAPLRDHPRIQATEAQERAAQSQVGVARTARRPNITWSVMAGVRPEYDQMVSAQVSIPLQINRKGLQNRRIAEAEARASAAHLRTADAVRELEASRAGALARYQSAEAQIERLSKGAIPSLEASFEAAQARFAGGQGTLELPLNIVRRYVEANIQRVEQQGERARAAAELIYLTGETPR